MQSGCDRIATYVGASGLASTYPIRAGVEAPASVTMTSGEVRPLVMVSYVESESDALADHLREQDAQQARVRADNARRFG
jgi:hypothetical protein